MSKKASKKQSINNIETLRIDSRLIKLGKLFVPKTEPFSSFNKVSEKPNRYLSTGYFNYISIDKIESPSPDNNEKNSLSRVYTLSNKKIDVPNNDECSYQYVKVFTNIGDHGYKEEEVESFWNNKELVLFISMIHICDTNIETVRSQIDKVFKEKEKSYLIYYTFDYSDIIIFCKSPKITDYLNLIYDIDFNIEENLVEDSYTVYGYESCFYEDLFENNKDKEFNEIDWKNYCKYDEHFFASINIGLQSHNKLYELVKLIEVDEYKNNIQICRMYGRHDISIVNTNADSKWFLYALMKVDIASIKTNKSDVNGLILYETFIKQKVESDSLKKTFFKPPKASDFYEKVRKKLSQELNNIISEFSNTKDFENYIIPIQEIINSTLSVIKNNFAEEFILSMLESLLTFLKHIIELKKDYDISKGKNKEKIKIWINEYINEYFNALNCLVSTVMHTDRQFIQATAFNAVFFDVPPKLVAYYSSLIFQFREIMKDPLEKVYAFMFTPNLKYGITLTPLSNEEVPPVDRTILISIAEDAMYNFESVFRRLAHETAHYAGDSLRCREIRKNRLLSTLFYLCFYELENPNIKYTEKLSYAIKSIVEKINDANLLSSENYYSCEFEIFEKQLFDCFFEGRKDDVLKGLYQIIQESLEEYFEIDYEVYYSDLIQDFENIYNNSISTTYAKEEQHQKKFPFVKEFAKYYSSKTLYGCHKMVLGNNKHNEKVHTQFKAFIDIYKETYADIQSIILLNISFEEYLSSFVFHEQLKVTTVKDSLSDLGRILLVSNLFLTLGVWDVFSADNEDVKYLENLILYNCGQIGDYADNNKELIKSIRTVIKSTSIMSIINKKKNNVNFEAKQFLGDVDVEELNYPFALLYDYLLNCIKISLDKYKELEIINQIQGLRTQYKKLIKFNDIVGIIDEINKSNNKYKEYIENVLLKEG